MCHETAIKCLPCLINLFLEFRCLNVYSSLFFSFINLNIWKIWKIIFIFQIIYLFLGLDSLPLLANHQNQKRNSIFWSSFIIVSFSRNRMYCNVSSTTNTFWILLWTLSLWPLYVYNFLLQSKRTQSGFQSI